jgi:hypothetical protein
VKQSTPILSAMVSGRRLLLWSSSSRQRAIADTQ